MRWLLFIRNTVGNLTVIERVTSLGYVGSGLISIKVGINPLTYESSSIDIPHVHPASSPTDHQTGRIHTHATPRKKRHLDAKRTSRMTYHKACRALNSKRGHPYIGQESTLTINFDIRENAIYSTHYDKKY